MENQQRDGCFPRFYIQPVLDADKTAEAGHPVFKDVEYVEVIVTKSKNFRPMYKVTETHKKRWAQQYAAFKNAQDGNIEGYRLDEWSMMPRSFSETLKSLQIITLEQFILVPQDDLKILGPGIMELQHQAEEILDNRDEKQEQIDGLKEQNEQLLARLEALEGKVEPTAAQKRNANLAKARAAKKAKAGAAAAGG